MDAQEIISYIASSPKVTPVKAYVRERPGAQVDYGQAKVFGREGMKVAIGDVRQDALDNAVKEIIAYSGCKPEDVLPLKVDLTNREEYTAAADKFEETFGGPPHLLIQTAGVNSFGPVEASTFDDFDWVVGVCFGGVVNGLVTFVPRMIKAGGQRHIAATVSWGAFSAGPTTAPYSAAKAGVLNLMESYWQALQPYGIGVTAICPANIRSRIYELLELVLESGGERVMHHDANRGKGLR